MVGVKMNTKKISLSSFVLNLVIFILMLVFLIPFVLIIFTSITSAKEVALRGSYLIFPQNPDFTAYNLLLGKGSVIWSGYKITLFRVIVGTMLNLIVTTTLAYSLSKRTMPGRNLINFMLFFTMLFSGGLIPTYMLIRFIKLYDTAWVMIIPGLVSAWNTFILRNFFSQIPASLEESAFIDGANPLQILWYITIPISAASIAVIGMFYAVGHWGAWFDAVIYINKTELLPVQVIMRNIVINASNREFDLEAYYGSEVKPPSQAIKSAAIIVSTLPIILVYPSIQKYFVKGIMIGSIKG